MEKRSAGSVGPVEVTLGVISLIGLYIVSRSSYPVFHMLAELFSIIIGFGLFMLIWNSRRFIDNNYLVFISIAYLFIAGLDLIHALAYKGMDVFAGYGANLPTQLWIAARYAESLALLAAPFYINRRLRTNVVLAGFTVLFSLLLVAIFFGFFPDCYIDGLGIDAVQDRKRVCDFRYPPLLADPAAQETGGIRPGSAGPDHPVDHLPRSAPS